MLQINIVFLISPPSNPYRKTDLMENKVCLCEVVKFIAGLTALIPGIIKPVIYYWHGSNANCGIHEAAFSINNGFNIFKGSAEPTKRIKKKI